MPIAARRHSDDRRKHAKLTQQPTRYRTEVHLLYDSKWARASRRYRRQNPLCVECLKYGKTTDISGKGKGVVDHITPHRGSRELFWQRDNWQGLCIVHHNQKSAKEML